MKTDYLTRILAARVYDVAIESPLELAPAISRRTGNHILLKREDKQPVFSFKLRASRRRSSRAASSAPAPGTTRRAWRWARRSWARARPS